MAKKVEGGENLHTLSCYRHPLGVECACGRKVLVPGERLGAHSGNMRELRTLKFVCTACGSRDWTGWLFATQAQIDEFMAGTVVQSRVDGSRPAF